MSVIRVGGGDPRKRPQVQEAEAWEVRKVLDESAADAEVTREILEAKEPLDSGFDGGQKMECAEGELLDVGEPEKRRVVECIDGAQDSV
jgi:hypothetical protein